MQSIFRIINNLHTHHILKNHKNHKNQNHIYQIVFDILLSYNNSRKKSEKKGTFPKSMRQNLVDKIFLLHPYSLSYCIYCNEIVNV